MALDQMKKLAAKARQRWPVQRLAVVHRTGVVHGDLKPGNLLFRGHGQGPPPSFLPATPQEPHDPDEEEEARYGDLVIADFGIARLVGSEEEGAAEPW